LRDQHVLLQRAAASAQRRHIQRQHAVTRACQGHGSCAHSFTLSGRVQCTLL
jgi:hypothetical protein